MSPSAVAQVEPIHHATVFGPAGYASPTTCGRTEQPKPSASEWRFVTCFACLALRDMPDQDRYILVMGEVDLGATFARRYDARAKGLKYLERAALVVDGQSIEQGRELLARLMPREREYIALRGAAAPQGKDPTP